MTWYEDPAEMVRRRKKAGLSQYALAKKIGRSRSLVNDVERGVIKLRGELADKIWTAIADTLRARQETVKDMFTKLAATGQVAKLKTLGQAKDVAVGAGWLQESEAADIRNRSDLAGQMTKMVARFWVGMLQSALEGKMPPDTIRESMAELQPWAVSEYSKGLEEVSKLVEKWQQDINAAMPRLERKAK